MNNSPRNALMGILNSEGAAHLQNHKVTNFYDCPNTSRIAYLCHNETGKTLPITCGRYDCPVCGPKKIYRLKKALISFFRKNEFNRMMTLTLSSNVSKSPQEHYKVLQECWRRFITELRRTKSLRADQRRFQYVRVPEFHKSGFIHYHLVIDHYLEQQLLYVIWNHIVHEVTGQSEYHGSVTLTGNKSAIDGAEYITKYITKLISEDSFISRRYSKSVDVCLFPSKDGPSHWSFCFGTLPSTVDQVFDDLLTFFTCNSMDITSQKEVSEDACLPP